MIDIPSRLFHGSPPYLYLSARWSKVACLAFVLARGLVGLVHCMTAAWNLDCGHLYQMRPVAVPLPVPTL